MSRAKESTNPFYVLLVIAGIVFSVTACAYAVMTFRTLRGADVSDAPSGIMLLMEQYGGFVLGVELLLLGVSTFAAIALDGYRKRRADRRSVEKPF